MTLTTTLLVLIRLYLIYKGPQPIQFKILEIILIILENIK